jgi:hypothetical protein
MDQGMGVSTSAGHYVRLALILLASVFGLVLLGFAFGSSSASADDGLPDGGGLVPAVADVPLSPASTTHAAVRHEAPLVGQAMGSSAAAPVVGTLVTGVDTTFAAAIETVASAVGPVLHLLPVLAHSPATADAAASLASSAATISGAAHGLWLGASGPFGMGVIGASGPSLGNFTLPVAALGSGFLVLFFSRRLGLVTSTLPVSPVYETDTSPD